jgi:hypothetical protein
MDLDEQRKNSRIPYRKSRVRLVQSFGRDNSDNTQTVVWKGEQA